jgi:acyl-CoA thioester hydrolase
VTLVAQRVGAATIDFAQTVRRDRTLLVEGSVQIACVDRDTGRPRRLDGDLRARLIRATQQKKVTG